MSVGTKNVPSIGICVNSAMAAVLQVKTLRLLIPPSLIAMPIWSGITRRCTEYAKSYKEGIGKQIFSTEVPYKLSDNVWEELEQWSGYPSTIKQIGDDEREFIINPPAELWRRNSRLRMISYQRSELALFNSICKNQ